MISSKREMLVTISMNDTAATEMARALGRALSVIDRSPDRGEQAALGTISALVTLRDAIEQDLS